MSEYLTVYQIIYSSVGVMGVFVAAWVFLLQKDFQNRFYDTKQKLEQYRNRKKESLRSNLIDKKKEDEYLTQKLIDDMNILAIMKEDIKGKLDKINDRSKQVAYVFALVIIYAIFTAHDPEKQAVVFGGTMMVELHYMFGLFILIFVSWLNLLFGVNHKMNELESKEVDELIGDYASKEDGNNNN